MLNKRLENINAHLDAISLQKRLQIEAEHLKRIKCSKTLRFYTTPTETAIKINTRIINDYGGENTTGLWELVHRIIVCMDSNLPTANDWSGPEENENTAKADGDEKTGAGPASPAERSPARSGPGAPKATEPSEIYEWTKESGLDGFLVNRKPCHGSMQLLVKLSNTRRVYMLDKALGKMFDKSSDTKQNIIKDLYKYINNHRLHDYSTTVVTCDEQLERIFGVKSFSFGDIGDMLDPLLRPIGYCVIDVDMEQQQMWDISIECDDLSQMPALYPKNVQEIEKKMEASKIVNQKITEKIAILEEFIEDPIFLINRKIALESDGLGTQTAFYDNLSVQTAVFELLKRHEK